MAGHWRGPLHGIPIGLKDLLDTAGVLTTAASNQYRDRVPTEDAELVRQLKQAGAVIVGKLNLHEFAFGVSGIVSAFGPAKNPWDVGAHHGRLFVRSAAAVAAGLCVAAIGTDTAGSIRVSVGAVRDRRTPSECGLAELQGNCSALHGRSTPLGR